MSKVKYSDFFDSPKNLRNAYHLGREIEQQADLDDLSEEEVGEIADAAGVDLTSSLSKILLDLGSMFGKKKW